MNPIRWDHHVIELLGLGAIAGVIPVYLGLGVALMMLKGLNRGRQIFLIGLSAGILFCLFFDVMHEAVELTSPRDFGSWVVLLGSLFSASSVLWLLSNKVSDSPEAPALHCFSLT